MRNRSELRDGVYDHQRRQKAVRDFIEARKRRKFVKGKSLREKIQSLILRLRGVEEKR